MMGILTFWRHERENQKRFNLSWWTRRYEASNKAFGAFTLMDKPPEHWHKTINY